MEFVEKFDVKVPNALIVSGFTGSEKDQELLEYLEQHGSVSRVLTVAESSEFKNGRIIEFDSGVALQTLVPSLPYTFTSIDNPDLKYYIQALKDVYTKTVGGSATDIYLSELKVLAKLSGKDFEDVLREVMSTIAKSIGNEADTVDIVEQNTLVVEPTQGSVSPHTQLKLPTLQNPSSKAPSDKMWHLKCWVQTVLAHLQSRKLWSSMLPKAQIRH